MYVCLASEIMIIQEVIAAKRIYENCDFEHVMTYFCKNKQILIYKNNFWAFL